MAGTVRLLCVRKGNGVHECPDRVVLSVERGVDGDRWFASPDRKIECQVTLMEYRVAERIAQGKPIHLAGDNFFVDFDLSEEALPAGAKLRIGTALVEVTAKPHTGCAKFSARFGAEALQWVGTRPRLRGVHARVLVDGVVAVGDSVGQHLEGQR